MKPQSGKTNYKTSVMHACTSVHLSMGILLSCETWITVLNIKIESCGADNGAYVDLVCHVVDRYAVTGIGKQTC